MAYGPQDIGEGVPWPSWQVFDDWLNENSISFSKPDAGLFIFQRVYAIDNDADALMFKLAFGPHIIAYKNEAIPARKD